MTFSQSHSLNKVMWACFTGEKALESVSYFKQVSFSITSTYTEEGLILPAPTPKERAPLRVNCSFHNHSACPCDLLVWTMTSSAKGSAVRIHQGPPLRFMALWSTNSWAITMLQHRSRVGNYYNTTRQWPSIHGTQTITVQLNSQPRGDPYCLHNLSASSAQLNDLFQEHS